MKTKSRKKLSAVLRRLTRTMNEHRNLLNKSTKLLLKSSSENLKLDVLGVVSKVFSIQSSTALNKENLAALRLAQTLMLVHL